METLHGPLNKAQLELPKLFSRVNSEEELNEIKDMVTQYYAKKLLDETDRLWDERGYTQETMNQWLNKKNIACGW